MSRTARFVWVLAAATALCFVALTALSDGLKVQVASQSVAIFDARFFGYGPAQARAYLAGSSPEQAASYLGVFRQLDTLFPVLLCLALLGAMGLNRAGTSRGGLWVGCACAVLYLLSDLSENAHVAGLIRAGASVTDAAVAQASLRTLVKWGALALSFCVVRV